MENILLSNPSHLINLDHLSALWVEIFVAYTGLVKFVSKLKWHSPLSCNLKNNP